MLFCCDVGESDLEIKARCVSSWGYTKSAFLEVKMRLYIKNAYALHIIRENYNTKDDIEGH